MEQAKLIRAAIRRNEEVITGRRHWECRELAQQMIQDADKYEKEFIEGFIDETGKFWTRDQAFDIAKITGQIDMEFGGTLTSEDLW